MFDQALIDAAQAAKDGAQADHDAAEDYGTTNQCDRCVLKAQADVLVALQKVIDTLNDAQP